MKLSKLDYNSPVILSFFLISLLALALNYFTNGYSNMTFFTLRYTSFLDPMQYVRMFTYILGHVNYEHFIGNFLIILIVGPIIEEKYGSKLLVTMISISAIIPAIIQLIFFRNTGLLGASGIVFMLIILASFANVKRGTIPVTFIIVIFLYLGQEVLNGLLVKDNISNLTHIVGGLCGAFLGFKYNK